MGVKVSERRRNAVNVGRYDRVSQSESQRSKGISSLLVLINVLIVSCAGQEGQLKKFLLMLRLSPVGFFVKTKTAVFKTKRQHGIIVLKYETLRL